MTIVIVDYGSGNLRSAAKAFERAAAVIGSHTEVCVSGQPSDVLRATHVVLPGVGAFGDCRHGLARVEGLDEALTEAVLRRGRPFLGICVGMQLLADTGLEHGTHAGLGWIHGDVALLPAARNGLKVPHMGWNQLQIHTDHPVLRGLGAGAHAYFVHSYGFRVADHAHQLAHVDYGGPVTAIIGRDNLLGTQFHPEKSQEVGLNLIANFLRWRP